MFPRMLHKRLLQAYGVDDPDPGFVLSEVAFAKTGKAVYN